MIPAFSFAALRVGLNQMESNPAGIAPEQELTVTWSGPYAFPGFERDWLPALPDHGGVYLQTFAHGDGFLIYAPGEAGNFRQRFSQHVRSFRSGEYTILDAEQAQAGVRSEVWHGWGWSPKRIKGRRWKGCPEQQMKQAEFCAPRGRASARIDTRVGRVPYLRQQRLAEARALPPRGRDHPPPCCGRRAFAGRRYADAPDGRP